MPLRPLRKITLRDPAAPDIDRWLGELDEALRDPGCDRYRLCRDTLYQIYHPSLGNYEDILADPKTPSGTKAALHALDPHHITLEPEYYDDLDVERYAPIKPLLWLWQSFDRSPMGGGNVAVGVQLRRMLATHVFGSCGKNFKCFQYVEFSVGYNMEVGDDVVIHRHVLLDDRGGIVLGNRVSVADYANIYSHSHALDDQVDVTNVVTRLDDGVRITYHATVLAGCHVGEQAMIGAGAVLTKDAKPWHLYLGVPARPVRAKPDAPPEAIGDG